MSRHKLRPALDQWLHRVELASSSQFTKFAAYMPGRTTSAAGVDLIEVPWKVPTGAADDINQINSLWHNSSGSISVLVWDPSVALTSNNQWMQFEAAQAFTGTDDFIGVCVRHAITADTYYGFWLDDSAYEIFKMIAGSKTVLKTAVYAPAINKEYRLEVSGTTLTAYEDDVVVDTATDSDIASGSLGVIAVGVASPGTSANRIRGGNLPVGNLPMWNRWVISPDGRNWLGSDLNLNPGKSSDFGLAVGETGTSGLPYYVEFDFLEYRQISMIRSHGTTANYFDLTITVKAKLELADAWTTLGTGLVMSNAGIDRWRYAQFDEMIARYARVEITSTPHGTWAATEEMEFWCGEFSELWWLSPTVLPSDAVGTWQAKGAFEYPSSLINHVTLSNEVTNYPLTQAVGAVTWTTGGGWLFDTTNYLNTGWAAQNTDHTIIIRFVNANSAGSLPVVGDLDSAGKITIVPVDATTMRVRNMSDALDHTVADSTAEFTIALAGDQFYVDGSLVSSLASYTPYGGGSNIQIGGVVGTAGDGDVYAVAIYNRELTATEVAAITTKMQAL